MVCKLSVNLNKIALLRNSRLGDFPSVIRAMQAVLQYGAHGITIHPRPDERHIRRTDASQIAQVWRDNYDTQKIEFNIEGYPDERFDEIIEQTRPSQATLVPDSPEQLTSDSGWNIEQNAEYLHQKITLYQQWGVRVSLFIEADSKITQQAKDIGSDRIEFYTGTFANEFAHNNHHKTILPYIHAHKRAVQLGLGINAGHDLNCDNLPFLLHHCPNIVEVSIGHALVADALYWGLEKTIANYLAAIHNGYNE